MVFVWTYVKDNPMAYMDGGFLPTSDFFKWAILLVIVEPHGNQAFPSHKAKGAYSGLKFTSLKAHPKRDKAPKVRKHMSFLCLSKRSNGW